MKRNELIRQANGSDIAAARQFITELSQPSAKPACVCPVCEGVYGLTPQAIAVIEEVLSRSRKCDYYVDRCGCHREKGGHHAIVWHAEMR